MRKGYRRGYEDGMHNGYHQGYEDRIRDQAHNERSMNKHHPSDMNGIAGTANPGSGYSNLKINVPHNKSHPALFV